MNIDEQAAADAIMSARHSDAFDREACVKILRDNLCGGEGYHEQRATGNSQSAAIGNETPSAQPKPESWPEIARETRRQVLDALNVPVNKDLGYDPLNAAERVDVIILAAIERSHAEQPQRSEQRIATSSQMDKGQREKENREWLARQSVQPPSSAKTTDDKQEWTVANLSQITNTMGVSSVSELHQKICDAHNAELSAERQRRVQAEEQLRNLTDAHILQKTIDDDKLLSALAAIEKKDEALALCTGISSIPLDRGFNVGPEFDPARKKASEARSIKVNLSALHEHDEKLTAEVRKPLVDALERCVSAIDDLEGHEIEYPRAIALSAARRSAIDALAKVKEGASVISRRF